MNEWKEAFWLMRLSFKNLKGNFLLGISFIIVCFLLLLNMLPNYIVERMPLVDVLFIFIFSILMLSSPGNFWMGEKVRKDYWGSSFIFGLNKLAIKKKVIIKSRFLTFLVLQIPLQIIFLISLYIFSEPFQSEMNVNAYIAFSIMWLCFAIYVGGAAITFDILYSLAQVIILIISLQFVVGFFLLIFYHFYRPHGLIFWTIQVANTKPLLAIIISLFLAFVGWHFWTNFMIKRIEKHDYFV